MQSVNMAVLGGPGGKVLAGDIGKKGSETDVTQFNLKKGDHSLTMFAPAKYPEKIQGVSYVLQGSDYVLLVVEALDKSLGEQIVAADLYGATHGFIILRNYIQAEQIKPLLAGTSLENYQFLDHEDPIRLREKFLGLPSHPRPGVTRVDVDSHFNVKGVGAVVLGVVTRGTVKRHQELVAFPTTQTCQVRSIQVHDSDTEEAPSGSRVGLALKGIENEDLDRGHVLAPAGSLTVIPKGEKLRLEVNVPKFYKAGLKDGQVLHIGTGMQFIPVRLSIEGGALAAGKAGPVAITVDNPVTVAAGDRVILYHLDSPGLRVAGGGVVKG